MARIASDLKLFEILSKEDNRVLDTKQLAKTTTADEVLLGMSSVYRLTDNARCLGAD